MFDRTKIASMEHPLHDYPTPYKDRSERTRGFANRMLFSPSRLSDAQPAAQVGGGGGVVGSQELLLPLNESFTSSFCSSSADDSAPELVDDDRAESVSSYDNDDEHQYHASTAELWDSFWHGDTDTSDEAGAEVEAEAEDDPPKWTVGDVDLAPAFPFRRRRVMPKRRSARASAAASETPPPEAAPFWKEEQQASRPGSSSRPASRAKLRTVSSYSLFPRPLQTEAARTSTFTNPFAPSSPAGPGGSPLSRRLTTSKSTSHLLAPNSPPTSPPPFPPPFPPRYAASTKRKPPPQPIKITGLGRPTTPLGQYDQANANAHVSPSQVSPCSQPPPPPSYKSKPAAPLPTPAAPFLFLNRPLPPLPTSARTNPDPTPTSFFDDSDDEDGAPSTGLAARIKGRLHVHRRAASDGRKGRGADEAAAGAVVHHRTRAGTEGEIPGLGKMNVLARMLRRSRA